MSAPLLVIISGPPGAGKTTVAQRLAAEFGFPALDRDDFKDSLFESLGWSDRMWSKRIGTASWELLFALTEKLIATGVSVIIDTNFEPGWATERLRSLRGRHRYMPVEIHCHAEPAVLARRFRDRWERGDRHAGHTDTFADDQEYIRELSKRDFTPVRVDECLLEVDTTDSERIDWESIFSIVRQTLEGTHGSQDG